MRSDPPTGGLTWEYGCAIQKEANRIAQQEGRSLVHPFDDPLVIAGNGTIGMEILKEVSGGNA